MNVLWKRKLLMKTLLIFVVIFVHLEPSIGYNKAQITLTDPATDRRQRSEEENNRLNDLFVSMASTTIGGKKELYKNHLRSKKINNNNNNNSNNDSNNNDNNNSNNGKLLLEKNHKNKTAKKQRRWQEIEELPFKSKNLIYRKRQQQQQHQQQERNQQNRHSHENERKLIDFYENNEIFKENFSAEKAKTTMTSSMETEKTKFQVKKKRPLIKSPRQFLSNNKTNNTQPTNKLFNDFSQRKRFISRKLFGRSLSPLSRFGRNDHFAKSFTHDFQIFFQAERHTIFRLHTVINKSNRISRSNNKATAAAIPKPTAVFHALSNKIGAAFGAQQGIGGTGIGGGGDYDDVTVTSRTEIVKLNDADSLRLSNFNPFNPTRILIHGWMGSSRAGVYSAIVPEYLRQTDTVHYNVFTLDWGRGAVADYITASYRVKAVGKTLAKFLDFLYREGGINFRDVYLIGFSMGAHAAGIAGKYLETGRIAAIYALDPALPFFHYNNVQERLDVGDADYVEVIHTNVGAYGYDRPLGHVDFYVNFGNNQPGCFINECNHIRAFQIFAESLRRRNSNNNSNNNNNIAGSTDVILGEGCEMSLWQDLIRNRRCLSKTEQTLILGELPYEMQSGTTELKREQHRIELQQRRGIYYTTTTTITR